MSDTGAEARAAVGVIETDAFCQSCGFNLHSQKVWRDERIGIALCRCPECGQHAAAGSAVTANSAWARRAALAGLVAWLGAQLIVVALIFFGLFGIQAMVNEGVTTTTFMTRDGQPVSVRGSANGKYEFALGVEQPFNLPSSEVVYGKRLAPWLSGVSAAPEAGRFMSPVQAVVIGSIFALLLMAASAFLASISWFWRRGMMWLWLLLPVVVTGTLFIILAQNDSDRTIAAIYGIGLVESRVETQIALIVGAALVLIMAAGLWIGRGVARLAISLFIPPRARQLFAFMWHCDGLTMPNAPIRPTL